jgi:spermidine synthase
MRRKSLLALFFLSGISSLIYEICWVRQATLTFGVSIYAYSAVLTAYMGGMAIGGYLIGKRADRAAHPLRLFAWLQIGMAGLGLLAPFALDGLTTLYAAVARQLNPGLTVLTALRLGMSLPDHPVGSRASQPIARWACVPESAVVGSTIRPHRL